MSKRCERLRILRLAATVLAATGLLGHGLAMLLVGLLASPVAAEPQGPYLGEICTPDGLVRLADRAPGDSGGDQHHGNPLKSCPVCTAFAQSGAASLPTIQELSPPECRSATQRPAHDSATRAAVRLAAQPRAPPARA